MDLSSNYFELFDLPEGFEVDQASLASQYRALQQKHHPDRFAGRSAQQQRLAEQYTAFINQAFITLKSPLSRAQYLLSLHGVEGGHENTTHQDTEFLFAQMKLRERLAEVRDSESPFDALDNLAGEVKNNYQQLQQQFSAVFGEQKLEDARELVAKMQFFHKLLQEIRELEADLDDM